MMCTAGNDAVVTRFAVPLVPRPPPMVNLSHLSCYIFADSLQPALEKLCMPCSCLSAESLGSVVNYFL